VRLHARAKRFGASIFRLVDSRAARQWRKLDKRSSVAAEATIGEHSFKNRCKSRIKSTRITICKFVTSFSSMKDTVEMLPANRCAQPDVTLECLATPIYVM
jgi:hypothetical protein